jgi:oleandomycin transport system ATP-binding protein
VREALAAVSDKPATDIGRGALTVAVESDAALAATVTRLHTAGVAVTELSLHLPSLDEVFFTITGQHAGDDDEEAAA